MSDLTELVAFTVLLTDRPGSLLVPKCAFLLVAAGRKMSQYVAERTGFVQCWALFRPVPMAHFSTASATCAPRAGTGGAMALVKFVSLVVHLGTTLLAAVRVGTVLIVAFALCHGTMRL